MVGIDRHRMLMLHLLGWDHSAQSGLSRDPQRPAFYFFMLCLASGRHISSTIRVNEIFSIDIYCIKLCM